MIALLLVALSVGLDNFGASVALGVRGVTGRLRVTVSMVFGIFEAGLAIAGLAIGHGLASRLGGVAHPVGASLLAVVGLYSIVEGMRHDPAEAPAPTRAGRVILTSLAISIDNLVVGFALGSHHVSLALASVVFLVMSLAMSSAGLELGGRLGEKVGGRADILGGAILIVVGVLIGVSVI